MNEVTESKTISEYISGIKRQKYKMFVVSILVFGIALAFAFLLPPVYESKATILIEQQDIPADFVRSTVTSYAEQQIQIISQRAMTRDNLYKIIEKYNLYAKDRKKDPIEEIIETMREDILVDTVNAQVVDPASGRVKVATIAFTISYKSDSPILAQKVANELVSLYLNENIKNRTEMAQQTSGFIGDESKKLNNKIQELEANMSEFKEKNATSLPEMYSHNMQILESAQKELSSIDKDLYLLKEKEIYLNSQIKQIDPYVYSNTASGGLSPEKQIKMLQTKKVSLSSLYREDHPDLKRVNKQLSKLEAEAGYDLTLLQTKLREAQAKYSKARQMYSSEYPDLNRYELEISQLKKQIEAAQLSDGENINEYEPDNPLYIQLTTQLETSKLEVESLIRKKADLNEKVSMYENRLANSPNIERQFRSLARDYENTWAKYRDLKAKQIDAEISQALEAGRKGERFTLIEPPLSPQRPKSPNRLMIIAVGIVFSLLAGFVIAILFDMADQAVYSERQLIIASGAPALAVIPVIETKRDIILKRIKSFGIFIGGVFFIGFGIFAINEWYKPLDIVWFVLMRKLDIV